MKVPKIRLAEGCDLSAHVLPTRAAEQCDANSGKNRGIRRGPRALGVPPQKDRTPMPAHDWAAHLTAHRGRRVLNGSLAPRLIAAPSVADTRQPCRDQLQGRLFGPRRAQHAFDGEAVNLY